MVWRKLKCSPQDLQLKATLTGGQSFRYGQFMLQAPIVDTLLCNVNHFRWKQASMEQDDVENGDASYIGVMANCVWHLRQDSNHLLYRILGEFDNKMSNEIIKIRYKVAPSTRHKKLNGLLFDDKYYEELLKAYFRMNTNLTKCYRMWSAAHSHFAQEADRFYAIRVLDQDPVENLFSFICSQNNHISR